MQHAAVARKALNVAKKQQEELQPNNSSLKLPEVPNRIS